MCCFLGGGLFLTLANRWKKKFKKKVSLDIKPVGPWNGLWLLKGRDRMLGHLKLAKKKKIEKIYCTEKIFRLDSLL